MFLLNVYLKDSSFLISSELKTKIYDISSFGKMKNQNGMAKSKCTFLCDPSSNFYVKENIFASYFNHAKVLSQRKENMSQLFPLIIIIHQINVSPQYFPFLWYICLL